MSDEKIREIEEQIEALESQWPAHSVSPSMLQRLDELEEALEKEKAKMESDQTTADN